MFKLYKKTLFNIKFEEVIMDLNDIYGMYKCTKCNNVEVHLQGEKFTPCPKCNKNSWVIIERSD